MSVSYLRLWKLLLDRRLKKTDLKELAGISNNTLARLGRDDYVSMESIGKLCRALDCRVEDIMEFVEVVPNGK